MKKLLAITNARVLGGASSLLLEGDRIAAVGGDIPADAEKLDARGAHIAPGIVDLGVFSVDKRACIAGGITRVALMPDQNPVLDEPGIVQRAALAAGTLHPGARDLSAFLDAWGPLEALAAGT